ncbi:MAG: HAMP domain-containing sensor histidine kinase [Planctomycetota bacterium]
MGRAVREPDAAWAELDGAGRVQAAGGAWPVFLGRHLEVGLAAVEPLPWLEGLLPAREVTSLPALRMTGHGPADVLLLPHGEGAVLVLLDAFQKVTTIGRLQQEGNRLSLLAARLTGRTLGGALQPGDDLVALLKMAVLECDPEGHCRPVGSVAPWMQRFLGADGVLRPGGDFGFLDNFLEDAAAFWEAGEAGSLMSGVWCEGAADGEQCFEATALLSPDGRRALAIERIDARFQERQRVLQEARQAHLDYDTLRKEVGKKEVLLQCLVHDLRAPLSNMVAVLDLLQSPGLDPAKAAALLQLAGRQAERQDAMMRELLAIFAEEVAALSDFATEASGAPDLCAVVRSRCHERGPAFETAGVDLSVDLPADGAPIPVAAHEDRLHRVLANLLGNALQHAPRGSRVEVQVRTVPGEGEVELSVLDRGPGVPPAQREHLFDRFARGAGSGGTVGLGLYFCRSMVRTWGGRIGYRDRPGGGAEFWIRLRRLDG